MTIPIHTGYSYGDGTGDIKACARCGQDHEKLAFKAFERPIEVEVGGETIKWLWWQTCPVTGDPIITRDESQWPVCAGLLEGEVR